MRVGLNFAKCNHKEEKINALQAAFKKELPDINFKVNKDYETFGAVININELKKVSELIVRILGE